MSRNFTQHKGKAVALDIANIDTDAIIPKQFLQSISREGFGQHLFHDWRFIEGDIQRPNPNFALNKAENQDSSILVTWHNFGCGSSREHAPWALEDYGFQVIIAPSFADIFYNNAFNAGILPVRLEEKDVRNILSFLNENPGTEMEVNLNNNIVSIGKDPHQKRYSFDISAERKNSFIQGLDAIGLTLAREKDILAFEAKHPKFL